MKRHQLDVDLGLGKEVHDPPGAIVDTQPDQHHAWPVDRELGFARMLLSIPVCEVLDGLDAEAAGVLLDERAESHGIESGQVGRIVEHLGYRVAGQRALLQLEHDQPAGGIDTKEIKRTTVLRDDLVSIAAGRGQAGTRVERHVRPLVIAALDRRLPAHAALRTDARRNAGFRPPYASRAAQSLVAIAVRIVAISAAAASWAIITDAGGVEAHWSSTRSASARRTTSRPTTTTSTARPAAASATHSAACCAPHVRTAFSVSSSAWTKTKAARAASSASGSLCGKYRNWALDRALIETARQHVLWDPDRGERVHLLVLGREPRNMRVLDT